MVLPAHIGARHGRGGEDGIALTYLGKLNFYQLEYLCLIQALRFFSK
ncbi:hypothetical protein CZ787_06150 [Halomonas citrativorans]|uniref:Uncharacterized protein n=1 Tax=Halomonas citrativorans TaxID=2742612 RepID=A0A1R4HVB8_9GAMM|nr:hypothetical protein CZ787_06150 [Halomonas citrativorans]